MSWHTWAGEQASALHRLGRWRSPRVFDSHGPTGAFADGSTAISFASNDYLGLSQHPALIAAAHDALNQFGTGSGSARLIVGARSLHHELETALAEWKHSEACVVFPTGYAANLGAFTAIADHNTVIFSDELNHASIIDGARLSRAEVVVYRHNDLAHLAELLTHTGGRRSIIASDTVFSMDGDIANTQDLVDIAAGHEALLILDEAHAVLGPDPDLRDVAHLRVGTMSKTLGSLGGFVAGPRAFTDLLVNRARSYIFTTAATPADTAAALAGVGIVNSEEGMRLTAQLRANVAAVRSDHRSPIIPVLLGSEDAALTAAQQLLDAGLLVPAIRPPTVAPGTCRLRIAMSALHTPKQIGLLNEHLALLPAFPSNQFETP